MPERKLEIVVPSGRWTIEMFQQENDKVVAAITNAISAVTVYCWTSEKNLTSEACSGIRYYINMPFTVRRRVSSLLRKWEKKTGTYGKLLPCMSPAVACDPKLGARHAVDE